MKIKKIALINNNIVVDFFEEKRKSFSFLQVYDFEQHIPVTRKKIDIENNTAKIPLSHIFTDKFYNGVKYVIDLIESHELPIKEKCTLKLNELYSVSIYIADNKKITFDFRAKQVFASLQCIEHLTDNNSIHFKFIPLQGAVDAFLCFRRRVSSQFWQFHDKDIKFPLHNNSAIVPLEEIYHLFEQDANAYWDVTLVNRFTDGSLYYAYVYSDKLSIDFNLTLTSVGSIYSGLGKTLILKLRKKEKTAFYLNYYNENKNEIIIKIKSPQSQDYSNEVPTLCILKKDSNDDRTDYVNFEHVCFSPSKYNDNTWEFALPITRYLSPRYGNLNHYQEPFSVWQIFIKFKSQYCPLTSQMEAIDSNYLPINDRLIGKIYIDKSLVYLYTHSGTLSNNKKIPIAVFGTCFTRNIFKSASFFNEDYKIWYDCYFTQFHSSIISMASYPYNKADYYLPKLDRVALRYLELDFHKNYFQILLDKKPKYILIDLYFDASMPTLQVSDDTYISLNLYLRYSSLLQEIDVKKIIRQSDWDHFFDLWKKSAMLFFQKLRQIVPEKNIILVRSRFATHYKDSSTEIKKFSNQPKILKDNLVWDRLENFILTNFKEIRSIDMRKTKWIADKNSPLGFSTSHYETGYYNECLNKLNKISLEDLLNGEEDVLKPNYNFHL